MVNKISYSRLKILVADDMGMILDLMTGILQGLGCEDIHSELNGKKIIQR